MQKYQTTLFDMGILVGNYLLNFEVGEADEQ